MPFNKKTKNKDKDTAPDIVMWAVIDNQRPDDPVTFTATHHDAVIALDQYLYLKHYSHFRLWCSLHNCPVDHGDSWRKYARAVIEPEMENQEEPLYTIIKIDYKANVIASLLRSFNKCIPLGCPFDTEEELNDYSIYFSEKSEKVERGEDTFSPLEEALNLLFEDLDAENAIQYDEKFNSESHDNNTHHSKKYDA